MYKIRFRRDHFETCNIWAKRKGLSVVIKSDKSCLLTSKVCPQGVVCPCPGAIYIYKIIKNVYKIRFLFLNLQWMGKVIRAFCWHQKCVPKGLSVPALGYIPCIKSFKMCLKSNFKEIVLKLATNGQSDKGFLLTSTFVPKGLSAPALGLYSCIHVYKL